MTPLFPRSAFEFEADTAVPEHVDAWPDDDVELDPTKFHIEGHIPLDGDSNFLAINIDDEATAIFLLEATRRHIESTWDPSMAASAYPDEFKPTANIIMPIPVGRAT